MKKLIFILTALIVIGCKNDKTGNEEQPQQPTAPAGNEFFRITLDVIAKKDDAFHVFYTEDGGVDFVEENSVWVEFKGSDASQQLVFDLPKDRIPSQLRIDFGLKDQGDIKINKLNMSYMGKETTISGQDFFKFFRPNEGNTIIDIPAQTLKAKPAEKFSGPSVYPTELLAPEIDKIIK